jgi:hypothetical protein
VQRLIQIREFKSQELRLSSNGEGKFTWMAGVYNYTQDDSVANGSPEYNVVDAMGVPAAANNGPPGTLRRAINTAAIPSTVRNQAVFAQVNLLDRPALDALFAQHQPRAVIHFAARAYVGESVSDPARYYRENVVATFTLLEAMRAASRVHSLPINILAHNDNARMIAAFLDEVSGGQSRVRVIEIDPVDKTYILEVKERIDAGELVAVLGDRLGLNDRFTTVEFFGAPARFPTGPYIMASALRCPVLRSMPIHRSRRARSASASERTQSTPPSTALRFLVAWNEKAWVPS